MGRMRHLGSLIAATGLGLGGIWLLSRYPSSESQRILILCLCVTGLLTACAFVTWWFASMRSSRTTDSLTRLNCNAAAFVAGFVFVHLGIIFMALGIIAAVLYAFGTNIWGMAVVAACIGAAVLLLAGVVLTPIELLKERFGIWAVCWQSQEIQKVRPIVEWHPAFFLGSRLEQAMAWDRAKSRPTLPIIQSVLHHASDGQTTLPPAMPRPAFHHELWWRCRVLATPMLLLAVLALLLQFVLPRIPTSFNPTTLASAQTSTGGSNTNRSDGTIDKKDGAKSNGPERVNAPSANPNPPKKTAKPPEDPWRKPEGNRLSPRNKDNFANLSRQQSGTGAVENILTTDAYPNLQTFSNGTLFRDRIFDEISATELVENPVVRTPIQRQASAPPAAGITSVKTYGKGQLRLLTQYEFEPQLGASTNGVFEIQEPEPGLFDLVARKDRLPDEVKLVMRSAAQDRQPQPSATYSQVTGIPTNVWPQDILDGVERARLLGNNHPIAIGRILEAYISKQGPYLYYTTQGKLLSPERIKEIDREVEELSKTLPMPVAMAQVKVFNCDGAAWIGAALLKDFFAIPTRVVAGRGSDGTQTDGGKTWLTISTEAQKHMWVEVWHDGRWVPFDMTPQKNSPDSGSSNSSGVASNGPGSSGRSGSAGSGNQSGGTPNANNQGPGSGGGGNQGQANANQSVTGQTPQGGAGGNQAGGTPNGGSQSSGAGGGSNAGQANANPPPSGQTPQAGSGNGGNQSGGTPNAANQSSGSSGGNAGQANANQSATGQTPPSGAGGNQAGGTPNGGSQGSGAGGGSNAGQANANPPSSGQTPQSGSGNPSGGPSNAANQSSGSGSGNAGQPNANQSATGQTPQGAGGNQSGGTPNGGSQSSGAGGGSNAGQANANPPSSGQTPQAGSGNGGNPSSGIPNAGKQGSSSGGGGNASQANANPASTAQGGNQSGGTPNSQGPGGRGGSNAGQANANPSPGQPSQAGNQPSTKSSGAGAGKHGPGNGTPQPPPTASQASSAQDGPTVFINIPRAKAPVDVSAVTGEQKSRKITAADPKTVDIAPVLPAPAPPVPSTQPKQVVPNWIELLKSKENPK